MVNEKASTIRFAGFRIDVHRRRLLRGATEDLVPLGPRAFDALLFLASRPGVLITKGQLMSAVWPDVAVDGNSLSQCISAVRKALGEEPGQNRFIATQPGRGYRFVAEPRTPAEPANRIPMTANPEALQAYVAGRSAITRPGADNLQRGVTELERAVRLDPDFALAQVCLADGYALLAVFGAKAPASVFPKARAAVMRALAIAPDFAEAHAELAHIQMTYELDLAAADASLARALTLDPDSILALHYRGLYLTGRGRFSEALACLWRAQALEPLAPNLSANIGQAHYYARRYHEATAQLQRALELDPAFAHAQSLLGRCSLRLGEPEQALNIFSARTSRTVGSDSDIPVALALLGRIGEATAALADLVGASGSRYVSAYDLAAIHAALGDRIGALSALEIAVRDSAPPINFVGIDPAFDGLHGDPRFEAVLRQLGWPS